jgi:radical SAM superfamily enzyme YgiQ (UPF0313 family)
MEFYVVDFIRVNGDRYVMALNILYLFPNDFYGLANNSFLTVFNRISNYLHSKPTIEKRRIEEEYLDLRHEKLPSYLPENINKYRKEAEKILLEVYSNFPFHIVAISCYSSYSYLNSVEIASMIKSSISSEIIIVVGGPHATIRPRDFNLKGIPEYIQQHYSLENTPFDFLIKEEGEVPFYKLIRRYFFTIPHQSHYFHSHSNQCKLLGPELLEDLNNIPVIDLELFRRYKDELNRDKTNLNMEFSRGCPFRCNYCPNSADYINCYKKVRTKSIDICLKELQAIRECEWVKIKHLFINDMIFLSKKPLKTRFLEELLEFNRTQGDFPFRIEVEERVDLCSEKDLINYKNVNIIPQFGLETASKTLLTRIGKVLGRNNEIISKAVSNYLQSAENLIKLSHKLAFPITFFYLIGLPGEDQNTLKESHNFFLKERFHEKALIEKYNINLRFAIYHNYIGTYLYDNAEHLYGTKNALGNREWWKIFSEDQILYSQLVDPSEHLSLTELLNLNQAFFKEVYVEQRKLGNDFYSVYKYRIFKNWMDDLKALYTKVK